MKLSLYHNEFITASSIIGIPKIFMSVWSYEINDSYAHIHPDPRPDPRRFQWQIIVNEELDKSHNMTICLSFTDNEFTKLH